MQLIVVSFFKLILLNVSHVKLNHQFLKNNHAIFPECLQDYLSQVLVKSLINNTYRKSSIKRHIVMEFGPRIKHKKRNMTMSKYFTGDVIIEVLMRYLLLQFFLHLEGSILVK